MFQRDRQPEWMDAPDVPRSDHQWALSGLSRLNRVSGVASLMYGHLRRHAVAQRTRPLRVLDVASGAGDVPICWARWARRDRLEMQITTLDISALAVEEQQRRAKLAGVEINALQRDCLQSSLPGGFDVVTSSLFVHHLDDHQNFRLLQSMQAATDNAILICDLERSRLNLALVWVASRLVTRSPMVHHDGAASVRAAYTREEFRRLAEDALARPVRISAAFPCRFIATFEEKVIREAAVAFA